MYGIKGPQASDRCDELLKLALKSKIIKKKEDLPWLDPSFAGNQFMGTRFTGRAVYIQLVGLEACGYVKLIRHNEKMEGFFGIIGIEVLKEHLEVFDLCPAPSRESTKAKYEAKHERNKAWKTIDKIWKTFGMEETVYDDKIVFSFEGHVADIINKRHQRKKKKQAKDEDPNATATEDEDDGKPFANLEMLANISTDAKHT